jgi:REP element-mobilizing transposase RayT
MPEHVPMLLSIPPQFVIAHVIGFIKGKAAIHIARTSMGRRRNFVDSMSRPWGAMQQRCVPLSRDRRRRINAPIRWDYGSRKPPVGG